MTLYEINKNIEEALEKAIDAETGEVVDDEMMEIFDHLLMDRDEKIENIGLFIKDLRAGADAIKEEAKKLTARARAAENKAEHLSSYLEFCLNGQKFSSPRCAISFRKSKKVEFDENRLSEVPEKYLRYKDPELNKKAVTEALKAGEEVPGCKLVDNVSIIIK